IAGVDSALLHGRKCIFFRFEDSSWAPMHQSIVANKLRDTSIRSQVAIQNGQSSARLQRAIDGVNHVLPRSLFSPRCLFSHSEATRRHTRSIQQSSVDKSLRQQSRPTCVVEI